MVHRVRRTEDWTEQYQRRNSGVWLCVRRRSWINALYRPDPRPPARTRSSGSMLGALDVDSVQEVQVCWFTVKWSTGALR
jgi:hypothetical protein